MDKKILSFLICFIYILSFSCVNIFAQNRTVMVDKNGKLIYPTAEVLRTQNNLGGGGVPYIYIDMSTILYQYSNDPTSAPGIPFDAEFKITDNSGVLIYWVSTSKGSGYGYSQSDYDSNPIVDHGAKIYFLYRTTSSQNRPVWIKLTNPAGIRNQITGTSYINGGIGGILIIPDMSNSRIKTIFDDYKNKPYLYNAIYLRCGEDGAEEKIGFRLWQNATIQFQ